MKRSVTVYANIPLPVLTDPQLPLRARGLYALLEAMKAQGVPLSVNTILEGVPEGVTAVRAALAELEAAGYLTRVQKRVKGLAAGYEWTLYPTGGGDAA